MAGRITLITGASAGIGYELAKVFAERKHRVALVARRADRLQKLSDEIVAAGGDRPIIIACDLQEPCASETIATALKDVDAEVEYLINNAGFGLYGDAVGLDRARQLAMIDLNVSVLTELCLLFADQLIRNKGGILNVGSVAGFLPGPRMAVYYATKAYVASFSEALHAELAPKGVRVTVLCPGPVPTEFQQRAGMGAASAGMLSLPAARVARDGYDSLMAGKRMVLPGLGNRFVPFMLRFFPRGMLLSMVSRVQQSR